jgi:hypothetical protein
VVGDSSCAAEPPSSTQYVRAVVKSKESVSCVVLVESGAFEVSYTHYAREAFKYVCCVILVGSDADTACPARVS